MARCRRLTASQANDVGQEISSLYHYGGLRWLLLLKGCERFTPLLVYEDPICVFEMFDTAYWNSLENGLYFALYSARVDELGGSFLAIIRAL